jgi:hypothetical protein
MYARYVTCYVICYICFATCHVTQHLNLITSEMFSFLFVDVHVVKVGSIVFSDLNHGSGTVEPWMLVSSPLNGGRCPAWQHINVSMLHIM